MSTAGDARASQGAGAGSAGAQAGGGGQQEPRQEYVEDDIPIDEPFAAKLSRWIWNGIKYTLGTTIVAVVFYAGYTIVITLLPGGASANAIMRNATYKLAHEPEIVQAFGDIKTYGDDMGTRNEGRRYFVPEYSYTDELTDDKYHRIRFSLEGERGQKARVWAEVRSGTYDYRYLIVLMNDNSRVWSVVDNRRPEPTEEERQARVTTLLQDAGWAFYADSELDVKEQAAALGDYWLKVKHVRCHEDPTRCEEAGATVKPSWSTAAGFNKGVKDLHELEIMTKPLRKAAEGKTSGWSLFGSK